jgi:hypothetical protein
MATSGHHRPRCTVPSSHTGTQRRYILAGASTLSSRPEPLTTGQFNGDARLHFIHSFFTSSIPCAHSILLPYRPNESTHAKPVRRLWHQRPRNFGMIPSAFWRSWTANDVIMAPIVMPCATTRERIAYCWLTRFFCCNDKSPDPRITDCRPGQVSSVLLCHSRAHAHAHAQMQMCAESTLQTYRQENPHGYDSAVFTKPIEHVCLERGD